MPIRGLCAALLLGLGAVSCGRPTEADDRDRVRHAIDAVQKVPNMAIEDRRRAIEALARTPAATPVAVGARDTCAEAYGLLLDGTEILRGVADGMAEDAGLNEATAARVAEAKRKVDQSRERMSDCDRAIVDLFSRR